MTVDEAIEILDNGEWWYNLDEVYEVKNLEYNKLHIAVNMAISALRATKYVNEQSPCSNCVTGWGVANVNGMITCMENCEKFADSIHKQEAEINHPLTLKELRNMNGKWVYIASEKYKRDNRWVLCHGVDSGGNIMINDGCYYPPYVFESGDIKAYRHKPKEYTK